MAIAPDEEIRQANTRKRIGVSFYMAASRRYDEELRAIGQALEANGITGFELYNLKAGYFVRDLREQKPSLRSTMWTWLRRRHPNRAEFKTYGFGLDDVKELSRAGRAKRVKPGQLTQFRSLSSILRTVGAYLDSKKADLIELHKRPISITLAYRDKSGHEYKEERPISSFYDYFLELHQKRAGTDKTIANHNS